MEHPSSESSRTSTSSHYNVIIVGAGLAGLSVARGLKGMDGVLLVDKRPIGSDPNPPHETLLPYIEQMGYESAVVQRFGSMDIRTSTGTYTMKFFQPHCTLNYVKLCELIYSGSDAGFRLGTAQPVDNRRLKVDGEILEAEFLIDCSGWRSLVSSALAGSSFGPIRMTSAISTTVRRPEDIDTPTYFFDSRIIQRGGGFVIPFGNQALVGLASYVGQEDLRPNLSRLLKAARAEPGVVSRDFIPNHGLRPLVVGNVFAVGDAAGQSKPVRGKGILRSTLYGLKCGQLIRQVLDGDKSLEEAKRDYMDYVEKEAPIYSLMLGLQEFLSTAPSSMQTFVAAGIANDASSFFWDKMY
ncbi:MAG TPA: NAD(P)/FAD-dependent oxidoreductase [Methanotrichaceae archaeon]|nr:NAD(P)/FAD-dependent oxidoreductase [Methanotrichaceae archaeon]